MTREWMYYIAHTPTMEIIEALDNAEDREYTPILDKAGTSGFKMSQRDPVSRLIKPWETCLVVKQQVNEYQTKIRWSGPIISKLRQWPTMNLSVNAIGWFEYLGRRLRDSDRTWSALAQTDGKIIHDLLDDENAKYPTLITKGFQGALQVRDAQLKRLQNVGQEIQNLCALENGCDFILDPETRQMNMYSFRGDILDDVVFFAMTEDVNSLGDSNIQEMSETEDGSTLANDIFAIASDGVAHQRDDSSVAKYGLFEDQVQITEKPLSTGVPLAYAAAETAVRANPRLTYSFNPQMSGANVPRLHADVSVDDQGHNAFDIGDICFLSVIDDDWDPPTSRQAIRLFGATNSIDQNDNAHVTSILTSPS